MSEGLLVVTSCTAMKRDTPDGDLHTAEALYTGQQHVRLLRGVAAYRRAGQPLGALRLRILSAFYGLLPAEKRISSYDRSYSGLPVGTIRRQAREQRVPQGIRRLLAQPFAGGVLLLGDPYLRACDLDEHVRLGGPLVSFCSPAAARRLPRISGLRMVPLANAEARRFSVGLVALKGELGARLLLRLSEDPGGFEQLTAPGADVLSWLEAAPGRRMLDRAAAA